MRKDETQIFLRILSDWFTVFLPKVKGVSPKTLESYKDCFRLLFSYLDEKKGISADKVSFLNLDSNAILDFLQWLEDERDCSFSTRNQRLSALCSFSAYAQNRDLEAATTFRTTLLRIPQKRTQKVARAYFSKEEVGLLLTIPDTSTAIGLRDSVLLSLMYATGARAQEICSLKVRDICFIESGARISILGKGGKRRSIIIGKTPAKIISGYISKRKRSLNDDSHIFSSQTHEMMTVSGIEEIFSKYVGIAKTKYPDKFRAASYPPHSMRHTTACHMLESGVSIISIKNFLGHASVTTTEIYAEMTQSSLDKAVKEWNDRWFGKKENVLEQTVKPSLPDFLLKT